MTKNFKAKAAALCASVAMAALGTVAQAHLTTIGYADNGNGTVTVFGEHWHGDLSYAYTANGGMHITEGTVTVAFPWVGVINNVPISGMGFTGWATVYPGLSDTYQDWIYTAPIITGNGTFTFYTGADCCVDEMDYGPLTLTLSGLSTVNPHNPGWPVPEPTTWAMIISGLGLTGAALRQRRSAAAPA